MKTYVVYSRGCPQGARVEVAGWVRPVPMHEWAEARRQKEQRERSREAARALAALD